MAEKSKVTKPLGVLSSTGAKRAEPGAKSTAGNQDLEKGKIAPMGVGLTEGERNALKALAEEHELTPNALMRYALRRFIVEVRAGNIDLEQELVQVPQKKRLKLPS